MNLKYISEELETIENKINHEFFRDKKITLTGSSGLIGSYLLAYFCWLNKKKYNLKVTSISRSKLPSHLNWVLEDKSFKHLELDLTDCSQLIKLPVSDVVIHGAGYAQPSIFMSNPSATLSINVVATLALLENMKSDGTFIFMSSSEVYCGNQGQACSEYDCGTSTPYHPRSSYIEGKRAGEAACAAYKSKGVRTISIRLGDIYGPGTRKYDQRALNSFIERGLLDRKIELKDQGNSKRNYCYILDALESILNITCDGKEQLYNLGGSVFISIKELALLIGDLTGSEVIFPKIDNEIAGAPAALNLDLSRLRTEFKKNDYISIREGLIKTISWQRELYQLI